MKKAIILLLLLISFSVGAQVREYSTMLKIKGTEIEAPQKVDAYLIFNDPHITFFKNDIKYKFDIISDIEDCPSAVTNEVFMCFEARLESSGAKFWFKMTKDGEKFTMQRMAPNSVVQVFSN